METCLMSHERNRLRNKLKKRDICQQKKERKNRRYIDI